MKRIIQFLFLLSVCVSSWAMGSSPLIFNGSIPENGQSVSSLETITLNWDLSNVIETFGNDTWGVCVLTQNYDTVEEKLYSVLYEGTPDEGNVLAIDDTQIRYTKVKEGNTTTLSFPNVSVRPGQLYTVVITSQFYVQKPKKNNTALKEASWYDTPITLTFYGQKTNDLWVESVLPTGESPIPSINDLQIEFSSNISLRENALANIYEGTDLIATTSSFKVDENDSRILLVSFENVPLYSTHEYNIVVDANSVVDENGNGNEEISRIYSGASFHELKAGRVSPANNKSISWLSTIYIPFTLEEGFCLSSVEELKSRLLDASGNVVAENIPFEQSQDMKSLTFNIWNFNLEPNSSYQFILDAGQIYPAYSANPTAKKKDTVNSEVVLNYITPTALDPVEKVALTIVPEDGTNNDRLDTMTLNLADYEFENNSYSVKLALENAVAIFNDGTNDTQLPLTFNANEKKATCTVNRPLEAGKTYTLKVPAGTFAPDAHANLAAVAANDELVYTYTGKAAPVAEFVSLSYTVDGEVTLKTMVEKGKPATVAVTVPEGRQIESVTLDGTPLSGVMDVYTIPALSEDAGVLVTLVPLVEPDPVYHNVTLSLDNAAAQTSAVEEGKTVSFKLTPVDDLWMVESVENATLDEASGMYVTEPVNADLEVKATFALVNPVDFDFTTGVGEVPAGCAYSVRSEGEMLIIEGVTAGDNIRIYTTGGTLIADKTVPADMSVAAMNLANGIYIVAINNTTLKIRH